MTCGRTSGFSSFDRNQRVFVTGEGNRPRGTVVAGCHSGCLERLAWPVGMAVRGGFAAVTLSLLAGCSRAPSRNILGSYFPSWMICALGGIAAAFVVRAIFKATGLLEEIPIPFAVILSIACAVTFALWLAWLA